jgi:integrase
LVLFLKQKTNQYVPKQAPVFTEQQLATFLQYAPNEGEILLQKLILLFGLYGGLRTSELTTELRWDDVESVENGLRVLVRH